MQYDIGLKKSACGWSSVSSKSSAFERLKTSDNSIEMFAHETVEIGLKI